MVLCMSPGTHSGGIPGTDEMKKAWGFRLVHCVEASGPDGEEIVRKLEYKLEVQKERLSFPPPEILILFRGPPITCYG